MSASVEDHKFPCMACKASGVESYLVEEYDMLVCPRCGTSIIMEGKSPLGRYMEDWKRNAEDIFPLVRPPLYQNDLANPRLFFLYEDCYHTLLIGRYNASIVLMGVLLEALMKERIELRLGKYFRGPYGESLKEIEDNKLMDPFDIAFLRRFKDDVRNPYQHADEAQIVDNLFVRVWPIQIQDLSLEKLNQTIKDIGSGKLKPKLLSAAEIPAFRAVVKREHDRKRAISLFSQVYDFLLIAKVKYFRQEDYDEHFKRFGSRLNHIEHYKV